MASRVFWAQQSLSQHHSLLHERQRLGDPLLILNGEVVQGHGQKRFRVWRILQHDERALSVTSASL